VTYNGATWIAVASIAANGNPPDNNTDWHLLAAKGATGSTGTTGTRALLEPLVLLALLELPGQPALLEPRVQPDHKDRLGRPVPRALRVPLEPLGRPVR